MIEPKPGSPPVCATMYLNLGACVTRRPNPYPPPASCGPGRHNCCISRNEERLIGATSGPSCGGHADTKTLTYLLRSLMDVSIPPIEPPAPFGSCRSSFHVSSSQRYPCASRSGGTVDGSSVVDVMPSGFRILRVTYCSYERPDTFDTTRPRIMNP